MCLHRLTQHLEVVTPLEQADDLSAAILLRALAESLSQFDKVLVLETQ